MNIEKNIDQRLLTQIYPTIMDQILGFVGTKKLWKSKIFKYENDLYKVYSKKCRHKLIHNIDSWIQHSHVRDYFPEFDGPERNAEAAIEFFTREFRYVVAVCDGVARWFICIPKIPIW
jgi:hypothetical protein